MNTNYGFEVPDRARDLAIDLLEILESEITWFKFPKSGKAREIKILRWAKAIHEEGLTEEYLHRMLFSYLDNRSAKDPVPEPRDVLEYIPDAARTEPANLIRTFIKCARRREIEDTFLFWFHWSHWAGNISWFPEEKPAGLVETLEQIGHYDLAVINRYGDAPGEEDRERVLKEIEAAKAGAK